MHPHPWFPDIAVLDDELAERLGSEVVARRTEHAWPLTSTDEIRLADGRRFAYKAQVPPTVEVEFYAAVTSPLLVGHHDLGRTGTTRHLVTEWLEAPRLSAGGDGAGGQGEATFVAQARSLIAEIARIDPSAPIYLDFSTEAGWTEAVYETARRLRHLIDVRAFADFPPDAPERLIQWSRGPAVRRALAETPRIAHGDLSPEEVFVTPQGYRVIDWQRPVLGPEGLDLVSLLRMSGIDPLRHVAPEVVAIASLILLHWAAIAPELVPTAPPEIYQGWALEALDRILGPA
jgi:hypothetical protein